MMKIQNRKLDGVVGKDKIRNYISQPYVDVDKKIMVATNGSILSVCPIEPDEGDTSGHIPLEAIKAAIKGNKFDPCVKANGNITLESGQTFPREDLGQFPVWNRVIPDKDKAEIVISLDAKQLKALADAICNPGKQSIVRLHIKDNNTSFYVDTGDSDCYGIIMPCRIK